MRSNDNYLKKELYEFIKKDSLIFDFFQDGSIDGVWYWDLEKKENEWMSPKFWETLGYEPNEKEHLVSEWKNIINPEDLTVIENNLELQIKNPKHIYDNIVRFKHKNGSTVWFRSKGMVIRDNVGNPVRMIGTHKDVSKLMFLEDKLKEKSHELIVKEKEIEKLIEDLKKDAKTDFLTGAYNRRAFEEIIEYEVKRSKRNATCFSLILLDLDDFKGVNDNHGHLTGDMVLIKIIDKLQCSIRCQDTICRWGGDEFMILLPDTKIKGAKFVAEKVLTKVNNLKLEVDGKKISMSFSAGVSEFKDSENIDECFKRCDFALYEVKKNGKNNIAIA